MGIYKSLSSRAGDARFSADSHFTPLAPALTGYTFGNARHPGCLTSDTSVRLHSCEKGNLCAVANEPNVVMIQPVVAHLRDGSDLAEAGVGGGGNDFQRSVELGCLTPEDMQMLRQVMEGIDGTAMQEFSKTLASAILSGRETALEGLTINSLSDDFTASIQALSKAMKEEEDNQSGIRTPQDATLPRVIHFPYARHSSYEELCHFVDTFKPLDVWPCTEDVEQWWRNNHTIESYFGEYCSGTDHAYDELIRSRFPEPFRHAEDEQDDTQTSGYVSLGLRDLSSPSQSMTRGPASNDGGEDRSSENVGHDHGSQQSIVSQVRCDDSAVRRESYKRTLDCLLRDEWEPVSLLSTDDHHGEIEEEL